MRHGQRDPTTGGFRQRFQSGHCRGCFLLFGSKQRVAVIVTSYQGKHGFRFQIVPSNPETEVSASEILMEHCLKLAWF